MKTLKNKETSFVLAILLMFSITASAMLLPSGNAHTPPWNNLTYAYCAVSPDPIGVGQSVNVNFWVDMPTPTASGPRGDRWENMTVLVTLPDGSTTTLGPFISDDTGGTHTTYTPAKIGNYTFVFNFPGQTLAGNNLPGGSSNAFIGDYYIPSKSAPVTLTVQQEPITIAPDNPFPTTYWTRPIYAENNNWYSIAGMWLGMGQVNFGTTGTYNNTGNYNPYTTAPNTAHILWTRPIGFGGIAGGESGYSETSNFYSTSQYEPKWQPIIMYGILYFEQFQSSSTNPAGWTAVDLHTGKTVWTLQSSSSSKPANTPVQMSGLITSPLCGQSLDMVTPNQYGYFGYLWSTGTPSALYMQQPLVPGTTTVNFSAPGLHISGTTFNMFDAATGNYLLSIINGSLGVIVQDPHGSILDYYINSTAGTQIIEGQLVTTPPGGRMLQCWNSTQCIMYSANGNRDATYYIPANTTASWSWRPTQNATYNFATGIMWAAPIATNYSGNALPTPLSMPTGSGGGGISSGVVLMNSVSSAGSMFYNIGWEIDAGYSSEDGHQLWIHNNTRVPYTLLGTGADYYVGCGYYTYYEPGALKVSCFSLNTGDLVWSHVLPNARAYDSLGGRGIVANGTLYMTTYGGNVYAYDLATGNLLWQYGTPSGGLESPYAYYSIWVFMEDTVADGKLFVPEGHMYSPPLYHGCQQLALNITNGQVVWSIDAFDTSNAPAISDGIMTDLNAYDNQIYAYGTGPTQTTISAPQVGVTTSTPVTITGTIMDLSAGSQQDAVAMNFPSGLPCVSDESMTHWMEYIYMQQPLPSNTTGVPVTLSVIDSNNNFRQIGTTTSDISGTYALTWTPDIPGNYTVIASFAGSQSYYASSAETHFYASLAEATPAPIVTAQANLATTTDLILYIVGAAVAIIIVIAIGFALVLRKRP